MTATGDFSFDLSSLTPATTYYFKSKAAGDGITEGSELSFTTASPPAIPPAVTTQPATNITTTTARLNGTLDSLGTASAVDVSFLWRTTAGNYTETLAKSMSATGDFSFDLSSLTPATTYYFKAKAVGDGITEGSELTFTTLRCRPYLRP